MRPFLERTELDPRVSLQNILTELEESEEKIYGEDVGRSLFLLAAEYSETLEAARENINFFASRWARIDVRDGGDNRVLKSIALSTILDEEAKSQLVNQVLQAVLINKQLDGSGSVVCGTWGSIREQLEDPEVQGLVSRETVNLLTNSVLARAEVVQNLDELFSGFAEEKTPQTGLRRPSGESLVCASRENSRVTQLL